jgi:hypothetical protein
MTFGNDEVWRISRRLNHRTSRVSIHSNVEIEAKGGPVFGISRADEIRGIYIARAAYQMDDVFGLTGN